MSKSDWKEVTLIDVADVIAGQSPPGDTYNLEGDGLPFLQGSREFGEHYPIPDRWCSAPKKTSEIGDILISVRAPVGDMNVSDKQYAIGRGLAAIREKEELLANGFIRLAIAVNIRELLRVSAGTTFSAITNKELKNLSFSLPPLEVQRQIVAVMQSIDHAISDQEAHVEATEKVRENTLHTLLTEGGDDWEETTLGEVAECVKKRSSIESGKPYIAMEHIGSGTNELVGIGASDDFKSSSTWFEVGDVLFGKLRPYLRKVWRANFEGYATGEVLIYRAKEGVAIPGFLFQILRDQTAIDYADQLSVGTRMPRVKEQDMRLFPLSLPPLDEQQRIVAVMQAIDSHLADARGQLESMRKLRGEVLNALLSGEHEIPADFDPTMRQLNSEEN